MTFKELIESEDFERGVLVEDGSVYVTKELCQKIVASSGEVGVIEAYFDMGVLANQDGNIEMTIEEFMNRWCWTYEEVNRFLEIYEELGCADIDSSGDVLYIHLNNVRKG